MVALVQGTFELLAEVDGTVFDHHRANRQHVVTVEVQAAGFQVEHHPALLAQAMFGQRRRGSQLLHALAQLLVEPWWAGAQPGKQAHSWYRRARLLCRRCAWRRDSRKMRRSKWLRLSGSTRLE
ncbi:hypothetical protein D3C80_1572350 [compost metagenome]